MGIIDDDSKKELYFVVSTRDDLSAMPQDVKDTVGHALYLAQQGSKAISNVKPLPSLAHGVMQISDDCDGNTYRAVYTVHYEDAIYVLHFSKRNRN
ncbi:MAG: type II toxin-antitoxin system RelE/ParE family toxin, partial [Duganella sp.]